MPTSRQARLTLSPNSLQAREGWDFKAERVITRINQRRETQEAAKHVLDFSDPATFWGAVYGHLLDKATRNIFSRSNGCGFSEEPLDGPGERQWPHLAGLYVACEDLLTLARACDSTISTIKIPCRCSATSCRCTSFPHGRVKASRLVRPTYKKWLVGGDGGCAFKQHSSVVIALRRFDIDPAHNARRCAWDELIVTAGPSEPPAYDSILQPTIDFFKKYDIGVISLYTWPHHAHV